ncbi:hypothetical protein HA402_009062 [Bradysia odoriphaga]|nr:hypothetical protein HA402_009062 [Bradysia odoriphaga]
MSQVSIQNTIKAECILPQMLCRICAIEQADDDCMNNLLTSIHEGLYFVDILEECLQRPIARDNGFPLSICLDCTSSLINVHNFRSTYNGSERKFKEMLDLHSVADGLEQKVEVTESESDIKPSYFIDCAAVEDVVRVNCDEIDNRDRKHIKTDVKSQVAPERSRRRRYECYQCKLPFRRVARLRVHLTNYHAPDKRWTCSDCQKQFSTRKNLMKHFYKHTSTNCDRCPETFTALRDLQHHYQRSHKDELIHHQCDQCPRKFVLSAQLRIHMHNHLNRKKTTHNCNTCSETFATEVQLKGHIRALHTTYLCSECGKTFKNNSLLASHQKIHSSDKPFGCSLCPSRFKWKVALTYHMTIHKQERKHVCETCGTSFSTRSAMKGHMKIHTGERPYECDKCSKRFYRRSHLKRHHLSHTGEKPFVCKYCDRGFRQCAQLNKHLRLHVGENTYQCQLCPIKFRLKAEMKKHEYEHYESKDFVAGTVNAIEQTDGS